MKYASEDLINEHKGIYTGLNILEQMVQSAKEFGKTDSKDIDEMADFFKLFADKCHHGKEEDLLFPAMKKAGMPNGLIGELLAEHKEGRKNIAEISAAIVGGNVQMDRFMGAATAYIALLRKHINKEHTLLFPMADQMLPMDEQKQLLEKFEEFEEEVMGKGVHEKLHDTLHKFAAKYLGED